MTDLRRDRHWEKQKGPERNLSLPAGRDWAVPEPLIIANEDAILCLVNTNTN
jgi:hypothetical protein